jgi:hypothetical protein
MSTFPKGISPPSYRSPAPTIVAVDIISIFLHIHTYVHIAAVYLHANRGLYDAAHHSRAAAAKSCIPTQEIGLQQR